jgi:hypothetical protein
MAASRLREFSATADRFTVPRALGVGGMGEVYEVDDHARRRLSGVEPFGLRPPVVCDRRTDVQYPITASDDVLMRPLLSRTSGGRDSSTRAAPGRPISGMFVAGRYDRWR